MIDTPRDPAIDSTVAMLREGYEFIWNRCRRLDTDLFTGRVLGQRAVFIHGREAAKLFYDTQKLEKSGVVPRNVLSSLFGQRAVRTLDGEAHDARKDAFLSLLRPEMAQRLAAQSADEWRRAVRRWEQARAIVLHDEVQRVLTAATCAWAGVRVDDLELRARDFAAMVDAFGAGLLHGQLAKMRAVRWLAGAIRDVRRGQLQAARDTAVHVIAQYRDENGKPLDSTTAAIELIDVIRPAVTVSRYITFAALALYRHPGSRTADAEHFAQEVRRFYPVTAWRAARVRAPFEWSGHRFEPGTLVMLDVYGMHRDPRLWDAPERFRPERFALCHDDALERSLEESITTQQVMLAHYVLTQCMTYQVVVNQDLRVDLTRMPARPRSGVVIAKVHATRALDAPRREAPRSRPVIRAVS